MTGWYVIAKDGHVADNHVDAWGPFDNEVDAVCFTIDLANDNGWEEISHLYCDEETAKDRTTKGEVHYPYVN